MMKYTRTNAYYGLQGELPKAEEMPPGFYTVVSDQHLGLGLCPMKVHSDTLHTFPKVGEVLAELDKFWAARGLYDKYGLVFRRGLLFHGPAGNGKSSLLRLIAHRAIREHNALVIDMAASGVSVAYVAHAIKFVRSKQSNPIIVLLEDIDDYEHDQQFMNLLDGSGTTPNTIFLATTNYLSKLPARIKNRPSRFDRTIEVGPPDAEVTAKFLSKLSGEPVEQFIPWTEHTKGLAFAHLKELFLCVRILGMSVEEGVRRLRALGTAEMSEDDTESLTEFMKKAYPAPF